MPEHTLKPNDYDTGIEPRYIVLEGVDGCGSTTQCKLLSKYLWDHNINVVTTKEPTDSEIGLLARKYLIEATNEEVHALLFAADRLEHGMKIQEWKKDAWVISDRGLGSSLVYQGLTCGHSFTLGINSKAMIPDMTIVIKVSLKTAMERLNKRWDEGDKKERFEKESFLKKVIKEYDALQYQLKNTYTVDGEQNIDAVKKDCIELLENRFHIRNAFV